ncbi:peptidylprolyl isomerase [Lyngbya aestuarii]|uniref:peptidylprolyl isomerase n=1 Tax=Lyngbya aestuarii TaxID=118322 RepID=UPI00403DA921
MSQVLQVRNQAITTEKIFTLLANYQMLPQFLREVIIDQAIASFGCTPEEIASACQQLYQKYQLSSDLERQEWLESYDMTQEQLEVLAIRETRIEKFKQVTWGHKLEPHFLRRKRELDQVIYSLIRTQDEDLTGELYFRLQEGEQSFAELAREYSCGPEAQTAGLVGPVELGKLPSVLSDMLYASRVGQLWSPKVLGSWLIIVRLEQRIPAIFNKSMGQRLLSELFEDWVQQQLVELASNGSISLN